MASNKIAMHPFFWLIGKIACDRFGESGSGMRTSFKIQDKIEEVVPDGAAIPNPLYKGADKQTNPLADLIELELTDKEKTYLIAALKEMRNKVKPAEGGRPLLATLDALGVED